MKAELFREDGRKNGRTDGQTDMTNLIAAFRNFLNAREKQDYPCRPVIRTWPLSRTGDEDKYSLILRDSVVLRQ